MHFMLTFLYNGCRNDDIVSLDLVKLCPGSMGTGFNRPGVGFNAVYPGGWFQTELPKCFKSIGKGWLPDNA